MAATPLDIGVFDHHPDGVLRFEGPTPLGSPEALEAGGAGGALATLRCSYANEAARRLLGAESPLVGHAVADLPGALSRRIEAAIAAAAGTGRPVRLELQGARSATAPGVVTVLLETHGLIVFVAPGDAGDAGERAASDVPSAPASEAMRAGEESAASKRLVDAHDLRSIVDAVPVAVAIAHDAHAREVTANRALRALPPWVHAVLTGRVSAGSPHEGSPARLLENGHRRGSGESPLERAARGEHVDAAELEVVGADGQRLHFVATAAPLLLDSGEPHGSIAAFVDVTTAVRMRHRLEALFGANLIGNVTWRLDGTITSANDAFLKSIDYSREELLAGQISWRSLTPQEYDAADAERLEELLSHRSHAPYEKAYVRRDGSKVPVLVSATLFPDSSDEGVSYIVDLTEVKAAERRIRELLEEVTAASRAKDEFLATLAHELRNPLAPIRNAVSLLRTRGPADEGLEAAHGVIERQVAYMARLLEDLLDVSRISRRKLDLRRKTLDLAAVLEAAVETSRPAIDAGHHRLVVDVAPRTFFVSGDAVRLAQVFANLIHNAAKYTPDRGQIVVFAQARGDHVVISVSDDGMGIEQALLEKVFEMFAQGPAPAHRGGGGLGIGLSLVKGIVELHGGSVEARSDGANRGSEFRVILPRAAPEVAEAIVPTAHAPRTHASRRVLVVDDNVDNADMLAALFEAYGHVSKALYSSSVALAEAAAFRPDVVLLDIGMPELDGHELCRRLRALPECGSALFIAMSGWGRPEDRVRSREAGFAHHEVKPLDPAALVRLLSTA